jgi:hypothetical protein
MGAPGPGSPQTGLRPWGGDLAFETWDRTVHLQPTHKEWVPHPSPSFRRRVGYNKPKSTGLVSGHEFTHAASNAKKTGLQPLYQPEGGGGFNPRTNPPTKILKTKYGPASQPRWTDESSTLRRGQPTTVVFDPRSRFSGPTSAFSLRSRAEPPLRTSPTRVSSFYEKDRTCPVVFANSCRQTSIRARGTQG